MFCPSETTSQLMHKSLAGTANGEGDIREFCDFTTEFNDLNVEKAFLLSSGLYFVSNVCWLFHRMIVFVFVL